MKICCVLAALLLHDRGGQKKCFQQQELSSLLKQGGGLIQRAHIQTVDIKPQNKCVLLLLFIIHCIFYPMADVQVKALLG